MARLTRFRLLDLARAFDIPGLSDSAKEDIVNQILRKHGCPLDKQEEEIKIELQQASLSSSEWTELEWWLS